MMGITGPQNFQRTQLREEIVVLWFGALTGSSEAKVWEGLSLCDGRRGEYLSLYALQGFYKFKILSVFVYLIVSSVLRRVQKTQSYDW